MRQPQALHEQSVYRHRCAGEEFFRTGTAQEGFSLLVSRHLRWLPMADNSGLQSSRRRFLISAPLFVATLVRCSNTLWNQTRFADAFVTDPDLTAYRPALDAVIVAVLPFERPDFPLRAPDVVRQRLVRMFRLESDNRFAALQRTLTLFDEIGLFDFLARCCRKKPLRATRRNAAVT